MRPPKSLRNTDTVITKTDLELNSATTHSSNGAKPLGADAEPDSSSMPPTANIVPPPHFGRFGKGASGGAALLEKKAADHSRVASPDVSVEPAHAVQPKSGPRRGPPRRIVILCIALSALGTAMYFGIPVISRYFRYESTDDAFINGHVTYISPRVVGRVTEVLVENNQYVEPGQVLVRIDREPFQIVADQKRAVLAQAKQAVDRDVAALDVATAQLRQARDQARGQLAAVYAQWYLLQSVRSLVRYEAASLKAGVANWNLQKANLELAEANSKRGKDLTPKHAMSEEDLNQREAAVKVAREQLDSALQGTQQVRALLDLPAAARPAAVPDPSVPGDLEETFPGIKYVVASAEQSLAQLGLPIDPRAAKADQVVAKIGAMSAESFIARVPAVEVAKAQLRQARAALGGESFDRAHPYDQPGVVRAQKELDQAELELGYTELRAPVAGFVSGRSVNPGNQVQVAQALMSVYPLNDVWVDANFKEGQLGRLRIGQSVDVYVDAYPGRVFSGRVAGFGTATGAAISLLPPENATGNFVKVVQRLPVRIEFTSPLPQDAPLFVGLSVEPEIDLTSESSGPDANQRLRGPLAPPCNQVPSNSGRP
jgi:membrane fusion protein, multidrug efflux system